MVSELVNNFHFTIFLGCKTVANACHSLIRDHGRKSRGSLSKLASLALTPLLSIFCEHKRKVTYSVWIMGQTLKRPIKMYNIEARAHKAIDKAKTVPKAAPRYPSVVSLSVELFFRGVRKGRPLPVKSDLCIGRLANSIALHFPIV